MQSLTIEFVVVDLSFVIDDINRPKSTEIAYSSLRAKRGNPEHYSHVSFSVLLLMSWIDNASRNDGGIILTTSIIMD
jgi:hypothetical protein